MPSRPSSDEGADALLGGDPALDALIAPLDRVGGPGRCAAPDPAAFEPLGTRALVAYRPTLDDEDDDDAVLSRLGRLGKVRWLYRQLRLAEIDLPDAADGAAAAEDAEPDVVGVVGVVGVIRALTTVGTTRGVVVGLNAATAFAARQAGDLGAHYRHPSGIGYPIITRQGGQAVIDLDPALTLPTPPALVPVINLSMGTVRVPYPTAMGDAVNLATAAASGEMLVVVAAGNCGGTPEDTMSAWARPEWVLSVGAAADPGGAAVADYSSVGTPGPDLIAYGASALNEARHGTSFAAPRVSALARLITAALCELGSELAAARGLGRVGVPAIGFAIIDGFDEEIWNEPERATQLQALPLVGVRADVVSRIVAQTKDALQIATTPAVLRAILLSAARAVPGADPRAVGAGFVDEALVIARLAALTVADLWEWFGRGALPERAGVGALRPFDSEELGILADVVRVTGPTLKIDYRTGRWASLPAPEDLIAEHPRGLPLDLTGIRF